MDPFSLTVGCVGLLQTIFGASGAIGAFIRDFRAARHDLDDVARELDSLQRVVELIRDDSHDH